MPKQVIFVFLLVLSTFSPVRAELVCDIFRRVDPSSFRVSERNGVWPVADGTQAFMEIVCVDNAAGNELVTNAIDWINHYVSQTTGRKIAVRTAPTNLPVLYVGYGDTAKQRFESLAGEFSVKTDPGPQGFIVRQIGTGGKKTICCWSPTPLGCRYGLIEFLRSLKTVNGKLISTLEHVVDAPDFPVRIHYINFAEHLQNAYNPNLLFDSEINRWSRDDWERYIDMVSAYRYNIFEFWLVPSLLGKSNEGQSDEFVKTINHVIAYAKRRGVSVHPIVAVNTLGGEWFYACPNDPKEKKRILDAWEFWTKSIQGNDSWGIFPGDPGGCTRNGCTKETFIDLALELSTMIRRNNPGALVEVGTWGEPFSGWGTPLWNGTPELTERSMEYLLKKLPEFPPGTFVSINRGFNPDADLEKGETTGGGSGGSDGRPYAKRAAALVPTLTWDFSVSEGENSVAPRCRVRRMIEARKKEQEVGCYSGGICFTMAPQLQSLSAFCSAEVWWNPDRKPEEILDDYGRWTFGEGQEKIGRLLEEFEVIPDWGYYAPFSYSATRLHDSMNDLLQELGHLDVKQSSRLPLAVDFARHVKSLEYHAMLFRNLAGVSLQIDSLNTAFQKTPFAGEGKEKISLADVQRILAENPDFDGRGDLETAAKHLAESDVPGLKKQYWETVYGIYDHLPPQAEDRKDATINNVFQRRFQASFAEPLLPSALEKQLKATGQPYCLIPFGGTAPHGWKMTGWTIRGVDGEAWSASFSEPGILSSDSFENRNYRWLVLRIAEGSAGSKKIIRINRRKIGEFVRTGSHGATEWFVTRSFPLPEGILDGQKVEIQFTEPGVGIAAVAFSTEEIHE